MMGYLNRQHVMNHPSLIHLVFTTILLIANSNIYADEPERTHDIILDDYFTLAYLEALEVSPDGKFVAYVEGRWHNSTNDMKADLWLSEVGTREMTRLTFDRANYKSLRWDSDSHHIFSIAIRKRDGAILPPYDGNAQVWRIPITGGEPEVITQVPGGIDFFALLSDGKTLIYTTSRQEAREEWASLRQQFKNVQYEDLQQDFTDIYKLDLKNWRQEKVAGMKKAVFEIALEPNGRRLALITAPEKNTLNLEGKSGVEILDLSNGELRPLSDELWRAKAPSKYGRLNSIEWSKDGRALAFAISFDGYPNEIIAARLDEIEPRIHKLERPAGVSIYADTDTQMTIHWRRQYL